MACISCGSKEQEAFGAEIMIHFPGLKGLDRPAVFAFPGVLVCFGCGSAQFGLPEAELHLLKEAA